MKAWLACAVGIATLIPVALAGPDERVAEIRKWYAAIQAAEPTDERKIAFEAEDEPLSGTVVVRDYDGGLRALTVSYAAGDHGGSDEHYYYKGGVLFFVYEVRQWWQFAPGGTPEKPKTEDTRTEVRYYFDGKTCVRQLERTAKSGDPDKLPAMVAKLEQKPVKPGEDADRLRARGAKLLKAKDAAAVRAAFE